MGWGRSGSTIMDNLLGELDGFFSVGELNYLWQRGLVEGRRCGCGQPARECELWSAVLARGWGGSDRVDARDVVRRQRDHVRVRQTWRLLRMPPGETRNGGLGELVDDTARLYEALGAVTGARVIVDSSKRPSDAAVLRLVPNVTPFFVQLVRDPRAVAYSWQRRKAQPDRHRPADLVQHGPVDSTLSWLGWNLAAESLRRRYDASRSMLLRYEDFVARPRDALCDMARLVGENPRSIPLEGERTARLAPNHTVSGNPSRFRTGTVELREDTEWVARQRGADRLVVTTLALPMLHRYGYRLRPQTMLKRAHR
jgi:hypothetical protein